MTGFTLTLIILLALFVLLFLILSWPSQPPYERRVTRSYNSRGYGREREPY